MHRFDRSLLHDLLHFLPAKSTRHSLILTTWLLAMEHGGQDQPGLYHSFIDEVNEGRWKIDKAVLRFLVAHGDSDARFHVLLFGVDLNVFSDAEFQRLFLRVFKEKKDDPWAASILGDVLRVFVDPHRLRRANAFRDQIDFLIRHPNVKVRSFAVLSAIYLNPPHPEHFRALRKGLFHSSYSMRLNCINALQFLLYEGQRVPNATLALLQSLRFPEAVKRFSKRYPEFASNAKAVLQCLRSRGLPPLPPK